VSEDRLKVFDATDGKLVGELSGDERIAFSSDGKYFTSRNGDTTSGLYDTESLELRQTLEGTETTFHLDLVIADLDEPGESGESIVTAYSLSPFSKRWRQRGIGVYDERGFAERFDPNHGPWLVGSSAKGYGVIDALTGRPLAAWRGSGYGCGYHWAWEKGTLVFVEGDLLTFWKAGVGATTHHVEDCADAAPPRFSRDRTRFVALNGIWSVATRRRVLKIPMPPMGGSVDRFSRDERLVLGHTAEDGDVAWSATDGHVVWRRKSQDSSESAVEDDRVFELDDETNGKAFWIGHAIDAKQSVAPIVFDEHCWAGPPKLPEVGPLPASMPARRCPELVVEFEAVLRARASLP
jgi:hypothetical protein